MLTAAPVWFPILDEAQSSREFADAVVAGRFRFNGEKHELGQSFDWLANPAPDVEWLILLHKFYYAPGLGIAWRETGDPGYARRWMELTRSWIQAVPVDFLPSDVAGRRIQNWISAWHYFEEAPQVDAAFRSRFLASLEGQVDWLAAHLTPARNHRTLELLSLFMAGVALPELPGASRWLELAREEIVKNLEADIRPDGVHCEQSTDYHHIVLRNALHVKRLASMNGIAMPEEFDCLLRRALEFSLWVHRPDGTIPSFSDGDTGSYLDMLRQGHEFFGDARYLWVESQGEAGQPPLETQAEFRDGGYYIWRSGWGVREPFRDERHLVFDCGPLGEGNHGHLDLLSFELYGFGSPLIVDPGRYTYAEDDPNWRVTFRGTAYHNTVTVDGRNQARYERHKTKHKIRGPHASFEMVHLGPGVFRGRVVSAEYDAVHEREIRVLDDCRFRIVDELSSPSEHTYDLWFHLPPQAFGQVEQAGRETRAPHLRLRQCSGARAAVESGWVSPEYGIKHPAPILRYTATGRDFRFETLLEVHR